jgi:DNA-binding XRE family transcriptional regulator
MARRGSSRGRKLLTETDKDQMVKIGRKHMQTYARIFPNTADRVWAFRNGLGMTQKGMAEDCDLSASAIGNIERGYTLGLGRTLVKIAKGVGISSDYVLGLSSKKEITK